MKFDTCFKTVFALLAFSAIPAMAVPYTIEATGVPNYLGPGNHKASFNGTSLLPHGPFLVNSLQFSFVFMDDEDSIVYSPAATEYSTPVVVKQDVSADKKTVYETVTQNATMPRIGLGEQESVKLSFSGVSFDSVNTPGTVFTMPTGPGSATRTVYEWSTTKGSCVNQWGVSKPGLGICQKVVRTTDTTFYARIDTRKEYTGQITFDGSLMDYSSLLDSLIRDKTLDFSLDVFGDLDLVSATLDLDIDLPFSSGEMNVPEPGSLVLFGIALLGMAGIRRKQRA